MIKIIFLSFVLIGNLQPIFDGKDKSRKQISIHLEDLGKKFDRPVDIVSFPDDENTVFVVEQPGTIKAWDLKKNTVKTVGSINVSFGGEMGLLGLAFHPLFKNSRRLFFAYNLPDINDVYRAVGESILTKTKTGYSLSEPRIIFKVKKPYSNHNAGAIRFGSDGYLYFGMGDGGGADDIHDNSQNPKSYLGKMIRMDIDRPDLDPEIWATGIRNPWKFAFKSSDEMVIADVGQNNWEEVSIAKKGDNLGWNHKEANHCFKPKQNCKSEGFVSPVIEYDREDGISITGGDFYKGTKIPDLKDHYIFADFGSGRIWASDFKSKIPGVFSALGRFPIAPSTFGPGINGDLLVADYNSGKIFKLVKPRGW